MIDHGWLVQVNPYPDFFGDEVVIGRRAGDGWEVLSGFTDDGDAIFSRHTEGDRTSFRLRLPRGVVQAIAEHVKPGPASSELARLEDALKVERDRVNDVLNRMWSH